MLKLAVLVVLLVSLTDTTRGYTCSCYCSSSNSYTGTAYSSSCGSSSCQSACYYLSSSCLSWSDTYGSCSGSGSGSVLDSTSYSTVLDMGTIIGIVIGSLAGVAILVGIIVTIIILHKRKTTRVWAVQTSQQHQQQQQQQQMSHPSFISGPGQQWPYGFQQQPHVGPMNNVYPLKYTSTYPPDVKV